MSLLGRCCLENRSRSRLTRLAICVALGCGGLSAMALAQNLAVPRRHDRPPGPPLSPAEAVAKMTVPEGFSVEVVASEPDVMNPVAMFIDEKGRYWITESFEYPRREPGPGRDRIKVLEDTDGDGKVDKVTVFAEGLNIPSGIAVGYGGVWVANSPDILFLQDTDGDLKADKQEVIVTGFGRTDTHELPNSFTWGPDGWLYGLNGVFNYCDVKYAETNPNFKPDHPGWKFTCAMWRIHPRTREFQIFAEGTSNPWGIAINDEGDFFISACVIDHLWHIVETGYYIRQGGPYPPHTWPIRSIVDHKHQKAAYCGITWFDSDVYPEEYRRVLYMGNIHGGCINADVIARSGSTYKGKPHPGFTAKPQAWKDDEYGTIAKTGDPANPKLADFLTANDPWFMPVVQTTGPDGCLYILDWYDRYHCYQDANADPAGIERERGRLYRVRYKDTPHAQPIDLGQKSDDELATAILQGSNEYVRQTAQRLLTERLTENPNASLPASLLRTVDDSSEPIDRRLRGLWTLAASGRLKVEDCLARLQDVPPELLRWTVRFGCELAQNQSTGEEIFQRLGTPSPQMPAAVRLQLVASGTRMIERIERQKGRPEGVDVDALVMLPLMVAAASPEDSCIQQVAWQNLYPGVLSSAFDFAQSVKRIGQRVGLKGLEPILTRAIQPVFDSAVQHHREDVVGTYFAVLHDDPTLSPEVSAELLAIIVARSRANPLSDDARRNLQLQLGDTLKEASRNKDSALYVSAVSLLALWGDEPSRAALHAILDDQSRSVPQRISSLQTTIAIGDAAQAMEGLRSGWHTDRGGKAYRTALLETLGAVKDPPSLRLIGDWLTSEFSTLEADLQPRVVELLCQRPILSAALLKAIHAERIRKDALNLNQLRRIATFKDDNVQALLKELYGAIREGRDPEREQVVNRSRDFLNGTPGDPINGEVIFKKVCAQCHKLHGEGADVGPDLTRNGRNDWSQLLANVLDPSQVIGPGYQARILVTDDGRTLTGLPVEESETQVVLKVQGGKLETIPRDQIEVYKVSELSMMPDQLERQVTPQELADLMSFLAHDRHPRDPEAKLLPGAPNPRR